MGITRIASAIAAIAMMAGMSACADTADMGGQSSTGAGGASASAPSSSSTDAQTSPSAKPTSPQSSAAPTSDATMLSAWSNDIAPNYYKVTGKAVLPDAPVAAGTVDYQGIDGLGRTGYAHGNLTYDMYAKSAGWRAKFDADVSGVSGWYADGHSNNHETTIALDNGRSYRGYFYNRSHLIADSLGGASSRKNIITGTRTQNVGDNSANPGGMAFTETEVRNLFKANHGVTVLYYVNPIYFGNEIVARGTTVDVRSSDGSIDQHVVVWNYANGHAIDYNTGRWS